MDFRCELYEKTDIEFRELENIMAWLSTLGGAFSSLGDQTEQCVNMILIIFTYYRSIFSIIIFLVLVSNPYDFINFKYFHYNNNTSIVPFIIYRLFWFECYGIFRDTYFMLYIKKLFNYLFCRQSWQAKFHCNS